MNKKNAIAVVAAAALLFGAAEASATGNKHGGGNHGGGHPSSGNVQNNNHVSNKNYNNVSNKNYNKNTNFNANLNKNTNTNTNNNVNKNSNYNKNTNTNTNNNTNNNTNDNTNNNNNQNNSQASANASATSNANSNSNGGDGGSSSVNIGGDEAAASSAAPVYLTSSNDTCMGSSGIGGQGMSFGFSLGTTWTDSNCIMLKNARELKSQGHDKAAKARLCMDDDNAMAFELAGEPCPRALASSQAAIARVRDWNPEYMTAGTQGDTPAQMQTAARRIVPTTTAAVDTQE